MFATIIMHLSTMYLSLAIPFLFTFYCLYHLLKLADSVFYHYRIQETCDSYLLCQRVEDLETEVTILKSVIDDISKQVDIQTDIHSEYVKLEKHRQDIMSLRDHNTILEKDIQKLQPRVSHH